MVEGTAGQLAKKHRVPLAAWVQHPEAPSKAVTLMPCSCFSHSGLLIKEVPEKASAAGIPASFMHV